MVPLFGVALLGWTISSVLILYWLESVIIGILNVPKILAAKGFVLGNIFNAAFFTVHFGAFCAGHGVFVAEIFDAKDEMLSLLTGGPLAIAGGSFFISHFVSMMVNFFGKKEYATRTSQEQMFLPYGRVVVMHIVILVGGFMAQKFGAPIIVLFLLIFLKTFFDLIAHNAEHKSEHLNSEV